jgi:hypothetical protein
VLFEVPEDRIYGRNRPDGLNTMEEIEGSRYEHKPIRVRTSAGEVVEATTFLVKPERRQDNLWTMGTVRRSRKNSARAFPPSGVFCAARESICSGDAVGA